MSLKKVEIMCGKLNFDSETKKVTPDTSKGKIILEINDENELRFQWINLSHGGDVQIERYIFGNDAVFERVKSQKRVFVLRFETDVDKFFFWMQTKDASQDDRNCDKFNELLNIQLLRFEEEKVQPQQQQQFVQQQVSPQQAASLQQNATQQVPQQFPQINQQSIQALLNKFSRGPLVELNDVLNQNHLSNLIADEEFAVTLLEHLPEGQKDLQHLSENLLSPQFQQAVDQLEAALRNEERQGVLASLEVDPSILQEEFDGVEAFLKALVRKYSTKISEEKQQ